MKNILFAVIALFVSVTSFAQTQIFETNLRVIGQNDSDYETIEMDYKIHINIVNGVGAVKFEDLSGKQTFSIKLTEKLSDEGEISTMEVLTFQTSGTEEFLMLYFEGSLVAVSLEDINGVGLYYVFNEEVAMRKELTKTLIGKQ